MLTHFNIRVYGLLVNDKKQVLLSDERVRPGNLTVTKFPGGGLELGEGTRDCLRRECLEEIGIEVAVKDHLYTTDYFQASAFSSTQQLISVYYLIEALEPFHTLVHNGPPVYPDHVAECFRFVDWPYFQETLLSLPVDKIAARILREKFA